VGGEGREERGDGGGWEVAVGSEGEDCGKAVGTIWKQSTLHLLPIKKRFHTRQSSHTLNALSLCTIFGKGAREGVDIGRPTDLLHDF